MKNLIGPFLFLVSFLSNAQQPQPYYSDVDLTLTGSALQTELSTKITDTHTNFLVYTPGVWEASRITDLNPDNTANVLLIYGYDDTDQDITNDRSRDKDMNGGNQSDWNREHVYPRSLGNPDLGTEGPGSDAHHLRPSDPTMNSNRSNKKFADGSGNAGSLANGGWYPGDEWKGDVARMMLYMYLRYGDRCLPNNVAIGTTNTSDANMIDLLLEWNAEDTVSPFEDQRNTYHDSNDTYAQGNRNPFIDNPYLATLIWGGPVAQDRWEIGVEDNEAPTAPTNLMVVNEAADTIELSWTAATDNIGVTTYEIYVDGVFNSNSGTTTKIVTGLTEQTTYSFTVLAKDLAGNSSPLSNVASGTTIEGDFILLEEDFEDCNTVATNFTAFSEASDKDWTCQTAFGEGNSGSMGMNGFQEVVASKDWLVTTSSFDFDASENQKVSFYLDYKFGSTPLELLYSSDYSGSGNPATATWTSVPNINIPTDSNNTTELEILFENVDISAITGTIYFAFKYYSDGNPTRWTLDNFKIVADPPLSVPSFEQGAIKAFPNPSNGNITIELGQKTFDTIEVFDITGKAVWISNDEISNTITINDLPKGFLIIKMTSGSNVQLQQKLIVR